MTRPPWWMALLAGVVALFALGCGSDDERSAQAPADVRLAAVIKALDNPFFVTMRDGLVDTARRHDTPLRVAAASTGVQDAAGQGTDLEQLAARRPACYVVNPLSRTNLISALANLPDNAPIVNIDSPVDAEAAKAVGADVSTYIGTDNVAAGRLAADAMARLVERGASVALVKGILGDATSEDRARGFESGIQG